MRIAQISPLDECVPPRCYGGTERVVHYLTEELVRRGHEVVLFASGDSLTDAELFACVPEALRRSGYRGDHSVHEMIQLDHVADQLHRFDILHFHTGFRHYPLSARLDRPHLTTMHGPLTAPELAVLHRHFDQVPLVSISDSQRIPLPQAHWIGTIPHGLPLHLYRFEPGPGDYLAFVGRVSPEKRLDRAIAIASRAGLPLRVAAKVDDVDRAYFRTVIEPLLLRHPEVEFIGEVDDAGKQELLGGARALLFPIDWQEPFGLVMIEANACGTPVIAWRNGSTPEVIHNGVNGVLVDSIEAAVAAVHGIEGLSRQGVRADFEQRFSLERQANAYEQLYHWLIQHHRTSIRSESRIPTPCLHAA